MKRLTLILFILIAAKICAAPYITIGDTKFFLAYAPTNYAPTDTTIGLREYIPASETLDNWNRLASIRIFKNQNDPEKYLKAMAATVAKSSPAAQAHLLKNDKTNTMILDFVIFSPESVQPHFAEWNLMRATHIAGKGLVLYQYAMRIYNLTDKTVDAAIAAIRAERDKMLAPFDTATFEEKEDPKQ